MLRSENRVVACPVVVHSSQTERFREDAALEMKFDSVYEADGGFSSVWSFATSALTFANARENERRNNSAKQ